jgi:hypothetical protein
MSRRLVLQAVVICFLVGTLSDLGNISKCVVACKVTHRQYLRMSCRHRRRLFGNSPVQNETGQEGLVFRAINAVTKQCVF